MAVPGLDESIHAAATLRFVWTGTEMGESSKQRQHLFRDGCTFRLISLILISVDVAAGMTGCVPFRP